MLCPVCDRVHDTTGCPGPLNQEFTPASFNLSLEIIDNNTGKIITDKGINTPDIDLVILQLRLAIERCEEFKRIGK